MFEPDKIYEKLSTLGTAWAELNFAAEMLEESKKTLISQLATDSNETSASAKESFALRHDSYIEHIRKMVVARKHANSAKVKYDSARMWAELKRTEAATERAANRSAA